MSHYLIIYGAKNIYKFKTWECYYLFDYRCMIKNEYKSKFNDVVIFIKLAN